MTRVLYQNEHTRITLDGGEVAAWHANPHRRPDRARVDDPAGLARFARWNLPATLSRFDLAELIEAARQPAAA